MTEPEQPTRIKWALAYARQARSDWNTYDLLVEEGAPRCHQVHYLQMAAEKIAKGYRFRDTSTSPEQLLRHHVGFTKFMNALLKSDHVKKMYAGKSAQLTQVSKHCHQLALEIEKLAPAVDSGKRPANPEYPWEQGQTIIAPCDYDFPNLSMLHASHGRTFLKLLKIAIHEFESIAIH
jgi:hypothetical protein